MIISHKLQVIFIKPYKVSGSSFETALRSYCGKGDISSWLDRGIKDMFTDHYNGEHLKFHISSEMLRSKIPDNIWNNYLKVSFVRDIYDVIISSYCYHHNDRGFRGLFPKNFNKYLLRIGIRHAQRNFSNLCIDGRCVIDFIIRYENADEDIKTLEEKIGCIGLLNKYQSMRIFRDFRAPGQDSVKVYSRYPVARALIDMHFSQAMNDNELIQKYYPLYKERLGGKIPEPGYLPRKTARLLLSLYNYRKYPVLREYFRGTNHSRHISSSQSKVKLV